MFKLKLLQYYDPHFHQGGLNRNSFGRMLSLDSKSQWLFSSRWKFGLQTKAKMQKKFKNLELETPFSQETPAWILPPRFKSEISILMKNIRDKTFCFSCLSQNPDSPRVPESAHWICLSGEVNSSIRVTGSKFPVSRSQLTNSLLWILVSCKNFIVLILTLLCWLIEKLKGH